MHIDKGGTIIMASTPEQNLAVTESGKNIIVSAGAGSGKTRVLTERVFDRICNSKYKWNIDDMLVLTFTNAAAANMKVRIRNKLTLNEGNKLTESEQHKQLNKIDSSYIMTFDAYAQFLVKKYHYILNVDKNIKIIDTNIIKNKINTLLDEILNKEYEIKNSNFINLINDFCIRDDNNLREKIIEINYKLNSIYNRSNYIRDYEKNFYNTEIINERLKQFTQLLLDKVMHIDKLLNDLSEYVENYKEYFVGIDNLLSSKTYEEIKTNAEIDTSKRMVNKGEEAKQIKKLITDEIKEIKNLTSFTQEEIKNQILNTKNNALYILNICEELNRRLKSFKKENNMYEFSDVFEMAIKLVDENSNIKEEIKNSFKEILIDEYQDTNDLQDEFISRIENNNVYMVGDIKQSIYRFRNANPKLFKNKYDAYSNNNGGIALKLTSNFRSRKEVLDGIDSIFSRIMDSEIGGADYSNGHSMIAGNESYNEKGYGKLIDQNNSTEIISYLLDKKQYPFTVFNQVEVEAFIIAKDIQNKVNSGYKVTYLNEEIDGKGNKIEVMRTRPVEYKDFTILVDRGTNFDVFKQILMSKNIPSDIQSDEKMDGSDLITVIRAAFKLLCCISNDDFGYDFKFAFLSLARSFVCEMKDSEIYDVITSNTYQNTDTYQKITKISNNADTKTISQILDEIIKEFNIYDLLSKIGDIRENVVRIEYLYQLSDSLNESGYNYYSFNEYLINVFDSNDDDTIKFKTQKDRENAVVITNIHQSKGLEYGICYYPLLTVNFNQQDIKETIIFDKDLGLLIPSMVENKGLKQTVLKDLYKNKYTKEDISERLRLFYVALTRAKEKAILVCPLENKTEEGNIISNDYRLKIKNYKDVLDLIYSDISNYINEIDLNDYSNFLDENYNINTKEIFNSINQTKEELNVKEKIKIEPVIIEKSSYSKKAGLIDINTINKMELGSKVHYYLQTLDFNNPDYSLIEEKFKSYIKKFIDSDLIKNKNQRKIYKEYEFLYEEDKQRKHGFIDLLIEYDDHFDIVDYKTKNIDDDNYEKQLIGYRKYIESISNKEVHCYLYSIIESTYKEIV